MCTIAIEALTPFNRTSRIQMYKNVARSRLFRRIAKRSIDIAPSVATTFVGQLFDGSISDSEMDMEMQRADVFLSCSDVSLILSITFF